MAKKVEALVRPELLVWARERSGFTQEEVSNKLKIPSERLDDWEWGEARPTISQLRKLAKIYKRPLAVFYLPRPPMSFDALHDFRRLPDEEAQRNSPELLYEIRQSHYRREIALNLYDLLEEPPPTIDIEVNYNENPEEVAVKLRQLLGISHQIQSQWKGNYQALNGWKTSLEDLGVLVFQATGVEISEMRGFSITKEILPIIAINIKDAPRGRIFSMLHEFTHIALRIGGLCDFVEGRWHPPDEQQIEVFCNHVAGAIMVPMSLLLSEELVHFKGDNPEWEDEELDLLARYYKASREVILRRLLIAGKTNEDFYQKKREEFQERYRQMNKPKKGFAPPATMAVSTVGNLFTRLVLDSYYQRKITSSNLSDFLNVRLKHFTKIEKQVLGRSVEFGGTE